jgi:cytoskeletal protein CcmA (bactofilin family)
MRLSRKGVWGKSMLPNFKKSETKPNGAAHPPTVPAQSFGASRSDRTISVLGPDLTVNGNLISKGELRVDGEVQGDIKGVRVVIGETACVTGGVVAEDVIILGHVMGSVRGLRVSLQSASHVEGDVYHQALVMEQGAFFEGRSRRADNPMADPPAPENSVRNERPNFSG